MSWFLALIILIRLGPFITTNANELTMFANQPLRNGHPTLHIAITPNAPLDAVRFIHISLGNVRGQTNISTKHYTEN
jgi:hypothetical protein